MVQDGKEKKMNISQFKNQNGELITLYQACELTNLGRTKVRQLADEAGASIKIGKSYRIKRKVLFDYIERTYSV